MSSLKKIRIDQVREGMYVEKLDCSWLQNPFWRNSFLLRNAEDVRNLESSHVEELWIDTARGLDVLVQDDQENASEGEQGAASSKANRAARAAFAWPSGSRLEAAGEAQGVSSGEGVDLGKRPARTRDVSKTDLRSEVDRAKQLYANSKGKLSELFSEARLGRAIDVQGAEDLVEEISDSLHRNPWALVSVARLKTADEYTYMHSVAVCALMIALGRELRLDDNAVKQAGLAGMLHDVGKAMVPMDILNKPGKLNDEEFAAVREHPRKGHDLLKEIGVTSEIALDVCLHHHEKMDGTGYPDRLPGDKISLFSRMGAICDVYDAVTSNRPYKKGWDPAESLRRMSSWTPSHFDKRLLDAFVKSIGIYPVGSLVRLDSGLVGVVVDQNEKDLLRPHVNAIVSAKKGERITPTLIDLSATASKVKIVGLETPSKWGLRDLSEFMA